MAKKKIASLGMSIDHDSVEILNYRVKHSLSEFDILIFQPDFIHKYEKEYHKYKGKEYLTENSTSQFFEDIKHWLYEIRSFISFGKTVIIISDTKEDIYYHTGKTEVSGIGKNQKTTNIVDLTSNYIFLETIIKDIKITSSKGKVVVQEKNTEVFTNLYHSFKDNFEYRVYFEHNDLKPIFKTKHDQIVGGIFEYKGALVLLPYIYINEENEHDFIKSIIQIDKSVKNESTPIPDWAVENHKTPQETVIYSNIEEKNVKIEELSDQKTQLEIELKEEQKYKELLFETGKSLENIIIESLHILGYTAENFTNGAGDEIDIILTSPEGHIYCGECEGKDNKAIDVHKFRQLLDHINVYEESLGDDIKDIYGILFGNAYRLKDIETREENFTKTCIERAKKKDIILVKTSDLYPIIQYLRKHDDDEFKKICRDTIHTSQGGIVEFPTLPVYNHPIQEAPPIKTPTNKGWKKKVIKDI